MKFSIFIAFTALFTFQSFGQNTAKLTGQITNSAGDSVSIFTYEIKKGRYKQVLLDKNCSR